MSEAVGLGPGLEVIRGVRLGDGLAVAAKVAEGVKDGSAEAARLMVATPTGSVDDRTALGWQALQSSRIPNPKTRRYFPIAGQSFLTPFPPGVFTETTPVRSNLFQVASVPDSSRMIAQTMTASIRSE